MPKFSLKIPFDVSSVEDRSSDEGIRVTAVAGEGEVVSETAKVGRSGKGTVTLSFDQRPKSLKLYVGPSSVSAEELPKLQALEVQVPSKALRARETATLDSLVIKPSVWLRWRRWCRRYTVSGRVLCPDGSPVPGAEVTAFDVDWCWWWSSKQTVGSATTDENGYYKIDFTWCCGYWPWWWWRSRHWRLEADLIDRIQPILRLHPNLPTPPKPTTVPDASVFEKILANAVDGSDEIDLSHSSALFESVRRPLGLETHKPLRVEFDPAHLTRLREPLLRRLPEVEELTRLRIWPWYPWCGWNDCQPDLIFRVTQPCGEPQDKVIVDEGVFDARWNVQSGSQFDLVALEACCIDQSPTPEGDCLNLESVCRIPVSRIDTDLNSVTAGYAYPAPLNADRPFAGSVSLWGEFGTGVDADYYELEWFDPSAGVSGAWSAVPAGAFTGYNRLFFHGGTTHVAQFPVQEVGGRRVIETRQHFENAHGPGTWGIVGPGSRWWTLNRSLLGIWKTDGFFADGVYRLRIKSWKLVAPDTLDQPRILGVCGSDDPQTPHEFVLRVDNQVVTGPGIHGDPCGPETVHTCTDEPETRILGMEIVHQNGTTTSLDACAEAQIGPKDDLRIRFRASDPDGHLSRYHLQMTYGENAKKVLIGGGALAGANHVAANATTIVGETYAKARANGAVSPTWNGGDYVLEVPVDEVFPVTCCYQVELRAFKRTIVDCNGNEVHRNLSERSFLVRVP